MKLTLLTALLLAPLAALNAAEPKAAAEFTAPDKGFLKKYCLDCHAGKSAQRDFDLEALQARPQLKGETKGVSPRVIRTMAEHPFYVQGQG